MRDMSSFQVVSPSTLTLAFLMAVPTSSGAQTIVEIDDDRSCPACVIEVGPDVTLAGGWEGARVNSHQTFRCSSRSERMTFCTCSTRPISIHLPPGPRPAWTRSACPSR